jgi:hypothetical protein
MGGCPSMRVKNDNDRCSMYKYVLNDFLAIIAQQLKNSKDTTEDALISC